MANGERKPGEEARRHCPRQGKGGPATRGKLWVIITAIVLLLADMGDKNIGESEKGKRVTKARTQGRSHALCCIMMNTPQARAGLSVL